MVNLGIIITGILLIILGGVFIGGSFLVVNPDHSFTNIGFGLFIGGLFSFCLGIYVIYRGIDA